MADRNPWRPAERRMDMENKERDNERMAKERYAQKQAELTREPNAPANDEREDAARPGGEEEAGQIQPENPAPGRPDAA
jgi:hypothetical protein